MRKFTLFLMSLLLSVGAMAEVNYKFEVIDIASNADAMLYSNAPCKVTQWGDDFKGWHVLFDDDASTFFHSDYSGDPSVDGLDHYWRVDMGEGNSVSLFTFTFTTRKENCEVNSPTTIVVEGSNEADGTYTEIATLSGLPTTNSTVYTSDILGSEGVAYRYIRYRVTATKTNQMQGGKVFFFIAEFGMSRAISIGEPGNPVSDFYEATTTFNTYQGAISNIINGNTNDKWWSNGQQEVDKTITIVLNNVHKLGIIKWHFCDGDKPRGAVIEIRATADGEWIGIEDFTIKDIRNNIFVCTAEGQDVKELRLRITTPHSNWLQVAEVELFAVPLPEHTVIYKYSYNGAIVKTVEHTVVEGDVFPACDLNLYGVSYEGVPTGTVTKDEEVTITAIVDEMPFEFAATYDEIGESWYYLSIGDAGKLLYHKEDADHIALDRTEVDKDNRNAYLWAFVGNPFDGYKLVNRAKGKGWILSSSTNTFDNNTGGNTYPIMTAEPVGDGKNTYWVPTSSDYRGGTDAFYLAQKDVNDGKNKMNNRGDILAYWNGGADAGSTFKVRHMNAIEPVIFNWTATTNWTSVDAAECSSSLMWDNRFTGGIKYIETTTEVESSVSATVTFTYTDGDCRLNIAGVEVVDANGNIVSGDYHFGYTGGSHDKNIYSVKTFEGGTYTVRCYATEGEWSDKDGNHTDLFAKSNGRITVELARNDVSAFAHNVTFAAEYATLHLGYKVAIPDGVKAYVAVSTDNGHVQFDEIKDVIPAATPVLLENVGNETTYSFTCTDKAAATVEKNLLQGSIANLYVTGDAYVLTLKDGKVCFGGVLLNQLDGTAFLNNANKAYLPKTDGMGAPYYSFRFGEGTTGIEDVKGENGDVKAIFDLTGRKLKGENGNLKGIYIINGKKVLVK